MDGLLALTIIILCILAAAAVSKRINGTIITMPMIYVGFGLLLSDMGFNIINFEGNGELVRIVAEVTLILVLASMLHASAFPR